MRFRKIGPAIGICALFLAGCGNTAGIGEFRLYADSVDALIIATEPITQRLRVAERTRARRLIDEGGMVEDKTAGTPVAGLAPKFVPEHAPYLADSGYPPFAGAVRLSTASLKRFNDAALVYAEGRALDDARDSLTAMIGNISGGLNLVGAPVPAAPVVEAFLEGTSQIGVFGSREAFRTLLKEEGGRLDTLLAALEQQSPVIFDSLVDTRREDRQEAIIDGDTGRVDALAGEIRADRTLIAEWVLLVRLSRRLLGDALAAIDAPSSAGARLTEAAVLTSEFQSRLDRIRTLLAENG